MDVELLRRDILRIGGHGTEQEEPSHPPGDRHSLCVGKGFSAHLQIRGWPVSSMFVVMRNKNVFDV